MTASSTPAAPSGRGGLLFVFVTVLLDVIGIGMVIPVLPTLIGSLTGEGISDAAIDGGWLIFVYAGMQFLFAPVIGNLSDRFGRRPVLLISVLTFGLDNLICALAPTLGWLFLGRFLAGISGGSFTTASAYIADISTPENRARNFGFMGMAFGIGFVLGPTLGGLVGEYGPRVPFFVAAGLSAANFLFGLVFLKETLPADRRRPFSLARANPLGAIREMRKYPTILGLAAVVVIYQIAHDANPSVWSYSGALRFGWSEAEIGLSLAAVGVSMAIVMGGLIGPIVKRLGERRAALAGLLLSAAGFTGYAFATEGWMMFVFMVPFAFIGLIEPSLRSIATGQVPENAQGELMGAIASLKSLTMVLSPILMTQLFGWFTGADAPVYFPGAPFLCAAVLLLIGAGLLVRERGEGGR
jgi:DHA1 family tetracycline resistance protein-like MFS transporter